MKLTMDDGTSGDGTSSTCCLARRHGKLAPRKRTGAGLHGRMVPFDVFWRTSRAREREREREREGCTGCPELDAVQLDQPIARRIPVSA